MIEDLRRQGEESSLIYVRSPASAARLGFELINADLYKPNSFLKDLSQWLADNVHPEWVLSKSIGCGLGIHHGRVPRAIAHLMISLFNSEDMRGLICTSSMIEGVNTAAQNVFIYDRHISVRKLDRFTFDNIKGRAGRLFKHKIGNVFLYGMPPDEDNYQVNIPLVTAGDDLQPELLFQLDSNQLTDRSQIRRRLISDASGLPEEFLSNWSQFGIEGLNVVAGRLLEELSRSDTPLRWEGVFPTYRELAATLRVAWNDLQFSKHDVRSPDQCAFYCFRWANSGNLRDFMDSLVKFGGLEAQIEIDRAFNFLRGAEYSFPQVLRVLSDMLNLFEPNVGVEYRTYAGQLQNLFLPGDLRSLDEFGVPLPIVLKIQRELPTDAIEARKVLEDSIPKFERLSEMEKHLVRLAVN